MNYEEIKKQMDEDYYMLFANIEKAEREMIKDWTRNGSLNVYNLNFRMAYFTSDGDIMQDRVETLERDGSIIVRSDDGQRWRVPHLDWVAFEVASLIDQIKAAITLDPDYLVKHRVQDSSSLASHKY